MAGNSKNRDHRVRSKKRKSQRESPTISYAKEARVSGLHVEIWAASDVDNVVDSEIHTLDSKDSDAIEGAIEAALANEGMDTNFETFDIGDAVLARGHRNGGFWVKCANQAMVDF